MLRLQLSAPDPLAVLLCHRALACISLSSVSRFSPTFAPTIGLSSSELGRSLFPLLLSRLVAAVGLNPAVLGLDLLHVSVCRWPCPAMFRYVFVALYSFHES